METSSPKDLLGQEIKVGAIVAYANLAGRSANQCLYEVTDVVKVEEQSWGHTEVVWKLKAKPVDRSYKNNWSNRVSTLAMMERCIVLPDSYRNLIT